MLIALLSIAVGTLCLLYALLRSTRTPREPSQGPHGSHLRGYAHRIAVLVRQLDAGTLSPEGFDEARRELERDLLEAAQVPAMRSSQ